MQQNTSSRLLIQQFQQKVFRCIAGVGSGHTNFNFAVKFYVLSIIITSVHFVRYHTILSEHSILISNIDDNYVVRSQRPCRYMADTHQRGETACSGQVLTGLGKFWVLLCLPGRADNLIHEIKA